MALEISYLTRSASNPNIAGRHIVSETRSLSGTTALSGVTPANADYIKITATEAARVDYSSATSAAVATSEYLAAGETIYRDAIPGFKVAGKTP